MTQKQPFFHWISRYRICFYAFLLPVSLMLLIFISNGIFPFGDRSFMNSDMYHQYVPFMQEFVRRIREGESLFYSWNIGIGSNYLALYIYYCASPFNWLALLFPPEYLIEFMSYLVIFKIGLSGFCFAFYLKEHFNSQSPLVVFVSLFYAMSGFVAAYNWNVMWMDCLFLAPLIILGLERLVKEKKCSLYCITLALSILSNYYISIMICIFLCLYFLVLLAELSLKSAAFLTDYLKAAGRFALYSILAGGIACVLLLPELAALSGSEFTEFNIPETGKLYFSLFDMIARHAVGTKAELGLDHWPNIFCSSAVFFLIPLYLYNRKIPTRCKVSRLFLCVVLLLSFSFNLLNYIWHGFNYPNSLPARQSFLYIFLILTLCFETVQKQNGISRTHILHAFMLGIGFLLLAQKLVTDDAFGPETFLMSMGFVCAYTLLFYAYRLFLQHHLIRQLITVLVLAVTVFEATFHMASTSVSTTSRDQYVELLPAYESLAKQIRNEDPGFYRIEKFSRTTKNDGALAGYPTASCFSSTANAKVGNWYDRMGMSDSKVFYCFDGQTPFSSALLSVRYMFSRSSSEDPALYTLVSEENGVYLYRCNYTLPAGFVLPEGFAQTSASLAVTASDPLILQNLLASGLGADSPLFLSVAAANDGDTASFTADTDGHYYAYSQNTKTDTVKMTSAAGDKTFKKVKYDYILDLGYQKAGETVSLYTEDNNTLDLVVYRLDTQALSQLFSVLSRNAFTAEHYDSVSLSGHVQMPYDGTLLLAVAAEKGWTLQVDGEPALLTTYDDMFLAVNLPRGDHRIELVFFPKGLIAGICISLFSIALLSLLLWKNGLTKTNKRISIKQY